MTHIDMIFLLTQPGTLESVGGKGLNLMRLTSAGMQVPPGFVISTAAYNAFTAYNQLDEMVTRAFSEARQGQSTARISDSIRAAFGAGQFPAELAEKITRAYRALCQQAGQKDLPVAVRSSATAEDLADASFAGQQDTYLNVRGEDAVLDAARRCFGSLWSERAIDYRARQCLPTGSAQLAVVIQQMVFAQAAGVTFSANPMNGDRNQMVIDAAFGLGEALVSGLVTPDHILLDKRTGKVLSYTVSSKTSMIIANAFGTEEQAVPKTKQRRRVLDSAQIKALHAMGSAVETYYGQPQDMEWCLADGKLYIVQARPITTLPDRQVSWDAPGPGKWMHGGGTFEMITEPVSPLFESLLLPIFFAASLQLLEEMGLQGAMPETPYKVINGFIYLHMDFRLRPWHLAGVLRDFSIHMHSMEQQEAEESIYRQAVAQDTRADVETLSGAQLLERMQALGKTGMRYWLQITKIVQVIYRREQAFFDFYRHQVRQGGDPEPEIFLRGQKILSWDAECSTFDLAQLARQNRQVGDILTRDANEALEALSHFPEGQTFLNALKTHLERFGHQLSSFDPCLPTLADDPRPVLAAIRAFLEGNEPPTVRQQRLADEGEQALKNIRQRLPAGKFNRFYQLLDTARQAARKREDSLFLTGLAWTYLHRCAMEAGKRLSQASAIRQPEDVFWLNLDEIGSALRLEKNCSGLSTTVAGRQAEQAAWQHLNPPYLLPSGSRPAFWWHFIFPTPELQRHPDSHTLVGLGVSPGKVRGTARVIRSLAEMQQLNPGEILVAHTTTPAWTPIFGRAAGLITDLGGPLAHGSIVAREYGIPAVMGTGTATQRIRDGQIVTLDGTLGIITLEK